MTGVWWGKLCEQLIKVGDVERKKWKKKVTKKTKFWVFPPYKIQVQLVNLQTGFLKKKTEGPSRWSNVTLPFSLTSSVDFVMLSPHIWHGCHFLALIPPSFTSVNPFGKFFRPLQSPSRSHNWGICMRIAGSTPTLQVIYRKCTSLKTGWAHRINSPLNQWRKFP